MSVKAGETQAQTGTGDRGPVLGERYEILVGSRLQALDARHAEAYEVRDIRAGRQRCFALVCPREILPRVDLLERFARIESDNLIKPVRWGVVHWPPAKGGRYAIVLTRPGGARLTKTAGMEAMRASDVQRKVIQPLAGLLQDLTNRMLTHRALRPDNLFYADDSQTEVVLGECVSAPPAFDQAVLYETIENGMANPSGRGTGTPEDDLYALGVLVAVLLTGDKLCSGMSDHEIVAAKLKVGSYGALLGRSQVPPKLTEPLRGLLCDDPHERWTARDLWLWTEGRQLTPKQPILPVKAARPFRFAGTDYFDTRSLAHAMTGNWQEALEVLQEDHLTDWIRRGFDAHRAELVFNATRVGDFALGGNPANEDFMVARAMVVLDPRAPVRYRDFSATIEGLGLALALDYHRTERVQLFAEIMRSGLLMGWFDSQGDLSPELWPLKKAIEQAGTYLIQHRPGYGIERCLYQLCPGWPCQSPLFERDCVYDIKDLLPALERVVQRGETALEPVDSHVAAYCAAHLKHMPERILNNLANEERNARYLAMLRLLAEVQRRTGPAQLPALGRWFADLLAPAVETFHNRPYRNQLGQEVERLVSRGVLSELSYVLDNESNREADQRGFAAARAHYQHAARQMSWLENGGLTGRENVMRVSRQAASTVSIVVSGIALVAMALLYALRA